MSGKAVAYCNAQIWTVDDRLPRAEAMLVCDGRIVELGSSSELARHADSVVDLDQRVVMPGIIDIHNHALEGGRVALYDLIFSQKAGFRELVDAVRDAAVSPNHDGWLVGHGWGQSCIGEMSSRFGLSAIDEATGDVPIVLRDASYHSRYANSAALRLAGIDATTRDPENGVIVRDPQTGAPTGLLHETAGSLVDAAMPPYSAEQDRAGAREAVRHLNSLGVTGFCQAVASRATVKAFSALDEARELTAWVAAFLDSGSVLSLDRDGIGASLIEERQSLASRHVLTNFAKFFMDGVPSMRTSAFFEPYLSSDGHPELEVSSFYAVDELAALIQPLDRAGMTVKVHAIGDRAISDVLDAIASVRAANGEGALHHIAHMNYIRRADIARLPALGVVADFSPPIWFPNPGRARMTSLLGAERVERTWPIRDVVESGAIVGAGSDWPCMTLSPTPWLALSTMLTRRNPELPELGVHGPDQRISLDTAIRLFTINPAIAMGISSDTGSLTVGKSADFIVLDRDIFGIEPEAIAETVVSATYFEGRLVHECRPGSRPD